MKTVAAYRLSLDALTCAGIDSSSKKAVACMLLSCVCFEIECFSALLGHSDVSFAVVPAHAMNGLFTVCGLKVFIA